MIDATQVAAGVAAAETIAEAAVPVLAPFHPLIALVTTAIVAHFNATGHFPTEAQVRAAVPADYQQLVDVWSTWRPSGDGSRAPSA